MRYFGFLSHMQADASGVVGTLYLLFKRLGLHCWLDMREENLTLEGMRQGVRDSSVFVLILTERVLGSWFCQQEILCAIEEQKPVQLVLEQESRSDFHPFDVAAWEASRGQPERKTMTANGTLQTVDPKIATMIDANLPKAITYRRRDFEVDAMMHD